MRRREVIALIGSAAAFPFRLVRSSHGAWSACFCLTFGVSHRPRLVLPSSERRWRSEGESGNGMLQLDFRYAEGQLHRLPALAADLVGANVDVIVTVGGEATGAARKATVTCPS